MFCALLPLSNDAIPLVILNSLHTAFIAGRGYEVVDDAFVGNLSLKSNDLLTRVNGFNLIQPGSLLRSFEQESTIPRPYLSIELQRLGRTEIQQLDLSSLSRSESTALLRRDAYYHSLLRRIATPQAIEKYQTCESNLQNGQGEGGRVTMNLKEAEVGQVVEAVSLATGNNYTFDQKRVNEPLTMYSSTPKSGVELHQMFVSLMHAHGYEVRQTGDRDYEIIPIEDKSKLIAILASEMYVALNVATFFILFFASRFSARALAILTSPITRTLGVYYGALLGNLKLCQLWIFARYFHEMKKQMGDTLLHAYVALPIETKTSVSPQIGESTGGMIEWLRPKSRVWVQGTAGSGKTELLQQTLRVYFSEKSLLKAWFKYGFIPLYLPLRSLGTVGVPALVDRALRKSGLALGDANLVARILDSGGFLLMLDGMNEATLDEDVDTYLYQAADRIGFIVTSQSDPGRWQGTKCRILPLDANLAKKIVGAFLGEQDSLANRVGAAVWQTLSSGYDCKLVADLVRHNKQLPTTRIGLYNATVDELTDQVPRAALYRLAWNMWQEGRRRFGPDASVTKEMAAELELRAVVVRRGSQFEFVHDLMRAYLAARYFAEAGNLRERLEEPLVWQLPFSEQQLCFGFLVELLPLSGLRLLSAVAAKAPDARVKLLAAVSTATHRQGLDLTIEVTPGKRAFPN